METPILRMKGKSEISDKEHKVKIHKMSWTWDSRPDSKLGVRNMVSVPSSFLDMEIERYNNIIIDSLVMPIPF